MRTFLRHRIPLPPRPRTATPNHAQSLEFTRRRFESARDHCAITMHAATLSRSDVTLKELEQLHQVNRAFKEYQTKNGVDPARGSQSP